MDSYEEWHIAVVDVKSIRFDPKCHCS
jgi:hypothetical protein